MLPDVSSAYQVQTEYFAGPLDLLLHLIEKEELDITQLALAQVTDQFLAYVEALRGHLDLDEVANFLVVAARLMVIKSRALLPQTPRSTTVTEAVAPEEDELVQQLRAYRQYKHMAQRLQERMAAGLRTYIRMVPVETPIVYRLDLSGVTLVQLKQSAQRALFPSEGPQPQQALVRPKITIVQQIRLIRERLIQWQRVSFSHLLSPQPTRLEAAVTLHALLELIKQRAVQVHQAQLFGDMLVEPLIPPEQISEASLAPEVPSPPRTDQ